MLANSKVVTLDGEPAEIFAGQTVPVVITSLQDPGGGGVLQTVQLEKIDVGVRLNITPRIGDDGLITTLVEPEVSRIIDFVGPDNDLPQTSTRRAKTLVRVQGGQRIYLGGLLTEETRKNVQKVPLLGDIPLLGALFRHTKDEVNSLDLVIEITPRIVGDEGSLVPSGQLLHPDMDVEDRDTLTDRQYQPSARPEGAATPAADDPTAR
ncbi:MAG TPA: type II and III secretion system protein [Candidatus Krumholzibacteria bacterium]|nr:type II and III secretion system protein [Candidatus Krumholzibacteria bacterium]